MRFVLRLQDGERMSDLCTEYGISRKTGYKFKSRFAELGPAGLYDLPRTPLRSPLRTPDEIRELLFGLKGEFPSWGPKKLLSVLQDRHPGVAFPSVTTAGTILKRAGLTTVKRRRRSSGGLASTPLTVAEAPNDVWASDYKGQFRLGNGIYCYPLTITDDLSRLILGCEGFECIDTGPAMTVFEDRFFSYGLPWIIRTDNGAPFASRGLLGLTRLSAYWLKQGIVHERIQPGHPEQNGRHERMHRTLKQETTRPAAANLLAQQERFDAFVATYNEQRPHEALDQRPPASAYTPSPRKPRARDFQLEYPLHDDARRVDATGFVRILGRRRSVYLTPALANERVGIRELDNGWLLVTYASLDLGWLDPATDRFHPADAEGLDD
jgi:transposase InsO family protein